MLARIRWMTLASRGRREVPLSVVESAVVCGATPSSPEGMGVGCLLSVRASAVMPLGWSAIIVCLTVCYGIDREDQPGGIIANCAKNVIDKKYAHILG